MKFNKSREFFCQGLMRYCTRLNQLISDSCELYDFWVNWFLWVKIPVERLKILWFLWASNRDANLNDFWCGSISFRIKLQVQCQVLLVSHDASNQYKSTFIFSYSKQPFPEVLGLFWFFCSVFRSPISPFFSTSITPYSF